MQKIKISRDYLPNLNYIKFHSVEDYKSRYKYYDIHFSLRGLIFYSILFDNSNYNIAFIRYSKIFFKETYWKYINYNEKN